MLSVSFCVKGESVMGTCLCPTRFESKLITCSPRRILVISGTSALRQHLHVRSGLTENDAVQRYGETTAEGKAGPSPCAAMVRAWLRQRRVFHSTRSLGRRDQRTRAAEAPRPSSAAMCPPPSFGAGVLWLQCGFILTRKLHNRDRLVNRLR